MKNDDTRSAFTELFVCPTCRSPLQLSGDVLSCSPCGKSYEMTEGIPRFAELGVHLEEDLDAVDAGPADSGAYQKQYQKLEKAEQYNADYKEHAFKRWSTQREFALLERLLKSQGKSARLLDLPCGGGRLSPALAPHTELLIESDIAIGQVLYAREHTPVSVQRVFMTSSAFQLPLADSSVDGVVCVRLNHHLPTRQEREKLMSELLRVASNFVIMTYFDYHSVKNSLRRLRRPFNKKPPKMTMRTSEVRTLAAKHGARLAKFPMLEPLSSGHRYALMIKEQR
jgi:SAM-dependent methyltransferase/uncharacterized protein YbaR (Trm112 family)